MGHRQRDDMILRPAFCLLPLAFALGCGPRASAGWGEDSGRLMLTGSSTLAPLMAEIGRRFEAEHEGVRIEVQMGGSSKGIKDARSGLVALGMASRELTEEERVDLVPYTIARDGVALIVHSSNPVTALDPDDVRSIYRGELTNWRELGGLDEEIVVVNKASGRATLEVFLDHFGLGEGEIKADIVIGDNQQGIKTVAGNPFAIGYVSIGSAASDVELGTPIRLLPAGGVAATLENVAGGRFPISRPLNLVSKGPAQGLVLEFARFAASESVRDLVEDLYFAPVTATR